MDKNLTNQPLVSFVMTAKDFEQYVGLAIESIVNQTYRNIELMVVDDGSTDRTTDIIRQWAAKDHRIKPIFHQVPVLPPLARNEAAAKAQGKYLAILDSDDICMPDRIEKQVAFMESHPEMLAACSHAEIIDKNGKSLGLKKKSVSLIHIRFGMLLQSQFIHSSMIIRKSVFDKLGGYRPEYMHAEDYDICSRILEIGEMTNIDEVLIKFRAASGGVTTQSESQKIQQASSLAISLRNSASYISLTPIEMKNLTDMMNSKNISFGNALLALRHYNKLTLSYLRKNESLTAADRQNIMKMYKSKKRIVLISYLKKVMGRK